MTTIYSICIEIYMHICIMNNFATYAWCIITANEFEKHDFSMSYCIVLIRTRVEKQRLVFLLAVIDCSTSCVFSQTGLVQTAEERLFIEPVGQAADSFSGWEHRVIREKHSSPDGPVPAADGREQFCQTIRGETIAALKCGRLNRVKCGKPHWFRGHRSSLLSFTGI